MSIQDDLEKLSKASGVKDLIDAHQRMKRSILSARRQSDSGLGPLARAWKEAIRISDQMALDGASKADRQQYVENVIRAAWPKKREEPWHYACKGCDDSGWVVKTCQRGSCGRPFSLPKQAGDDRTGKGKCVDGHSYAAPCVCEKGQGFRRSMLKEQPRTEDAMALAAKTSKPTKIGR